MQQQQIQIVAVLIEWVTIEKFCELSGYSPSAVAKKTVPGGLWPENKVWRWGDDGRKLIHIPGYNRHIKNCEGRPSSRGRKAAAQNVTQSHGIESAL